MTKKQKNIPWSKAEVINLQTTEGFGQIYTFSENSQKKAAVVATYMV